MQPLKKILIVGGGTAGWMTAAYLNRFISPLQCSITLVESANLGTIGVGEATVPPLVAYLRLLGIDEDDFLLRCNATYKLGIKFENWLRENHAFWHPFGPTGGHIQGLPFFHHWLKGHLAGRDTTAYAAYSTQTVLGELNRAPRSLTEGSIVTEQGAYAYHVDAHAFAGYLAQLATARGVIHLIDDVEQVVLDENGAIESVQTRQGGKLTADLYIDCSGFAGLLAEQALGDKYIDWSSYLLCDRAVAMPTPAEVVVPPYTRAIAMQSGWRWRIPLSHRVGNGYVYSSKFIEPAAAEDELLASLGGDQNHADPVHLRMRIGRRENFWTRNCVSIGLSAGFLEPLESTGIFLIQKGLELLLNLLPGAQAEPALAHEYNLQVGRVYDEARDFIILHYILNEREGSEFWTASRNVVLPPALAYAVDYYDQTGLTTIEHPALFRDASFYAITAGMGRLPRHGHAMAEFADVAATVRYQDRLKSQNFALAGSLPDHGVLITSLFAARKGQR